MKGENKNIIPNKRHYRQIPKYPWLYITKSGRLFSSWTGRHMKPFRSNLNGKRLTDGSYGKPSYYMTYPIYNPHKKKCVGNICIHRLVALAWLPNPDNLAEVDHVSGNRSNNNVRNLRWVSKPMNVRTITEQQILQVLTLLDSKKYKFREIAEMVGTKLHNVKTVSFEKGLFLDVRAKYEKQKVIK